MAIELDLSALNVVGTAFGVFLCLWGAVSYFVKERVYIGEAPFAVVLGVIISFASPLQFLKGSPGKDQDPLDDFSLGLSRFVIGVQLVLVGVQLPHKYLWKELPSLAVLLLPVMVMMWITTTALTWLWFPDVSVLVAAVLASCTTPTDPILANAIVKGSFADQYVSPRLRNLISAESGANDGLGYPLLLIAVHLIKEASVGEALWKWVFETCLYTVGGSVVYGALLGIAANRVLRISTNHNLIDKESFLLYAVALGIATVASAGILALDDLLAAFVAGNALTWDDWYRKETEHDEVQNVVDLLLNSIYFTFVGATIPWASFYDPVNGLNAGLIGFCVAVLLFRRVPAMLLHYKVISTLADASEALFMGYFGPIGAGAVFYASLVLDEFKDEETMSPEAERIRILIKPVTYALVLASIVGHTLTIPLLKGFLTWRGIGRIRLDGEEGDSISERAWDHGDGEEGSATPTEHESDDDEQGEAPPSTHRLSAVSGISEMSEVPSSVHRAARRRQAAAAAAGDDTALPHHFDGHVDVAASWRLSSAHKLGPHLEHIPSAWTEAPVARGRSRSRTRRSVGDLEEGEAAVAPGSSHTGSRAS